MAKKGEFLVFMEAETLQRALLLENSITKPMVQVSYILRGQ